jgi:ABC-type uncharacterized transport system fused permease/ATPase subunit
MLEAVPLIRSTNNNNNDNDNMDSNFIQMTAASTADEEQGSSGSGSPTRRRTAFTMLNTSSPIRENDNMIGGAYNDSYNDHQQHAPHSGGENGGDNKRQTRLREQLHSFRIMAAPYFRESSEGRCLFAIMVALSLANSAVRVAFSYLSRDFWSALSDKEEEQFYLIMTRFLAACVILAPISVAYRYQRQKLAIAWRNWLTARVLDLYFDHQSKVYYALERQSGGGIKSSYHEEATAGSDASSLQTNKEDVDNPDQRISEDIRSFTEFSLTFFLTLVTSTIDLVAFSFILFSIMPQLFVAIFGFATLGTFATICVGRILIRLNYESLAKEADFRFSLVRVRENAESIAFYAGEAVEERETFRRFAYVIKNMTQINFAQMKLDFVTTGYNYVTWILPIIVVAPEYFAGNVELGVISQASAAFGHILDDLSIVINSFTDVAAFSAGIDRLFSFMRAIQVLNPDRDIGSLLSSSPRDDAAFLGHHVSRNIEPYKAENTISVKEFDPRRRSGPDLASSATTILSIQDMRLVTPDMSRVLIDNLNVSLSQGRNLLIAGPSGAGKSSLLRAIAGLWSSGTGEIVRPSSEYIYFLPQRPYCPPGSLRDQLLYPSTEMSFRSEAETSSNQSPKDRRRLERDWSDDDLLHVLDSVDLPDLASRSGGLSAILDWSNTLSLGEQQRLAFGRLVINRPTLVVLDESTSALDVLAEKKMYTLLKDLSTEMDGRLTYVSVGHRPTLLAYHDLKLSVRNGTGAISDIPQGAGVIDEGFILT